MGIYNILELNPYRFSRILENRRKIEIAEYNKNMQFAWEVGRLCSIGFNNPKEYPQKPREYKEEINSREENIQEWRKFISKHKAI